MRTARICLGICYIVALLAFGSCAKPAAGAAGGEAGNQAGATVEQAAPEASSFIMLQGLSLWTRDGDAVKYAKSATIGDRVTVNGKPETLKSDGKDREFTPITASDGKDYWVRTPYLAQANYLAVVNDAKCVLYSEPKVINATKTVVPRLTIVAVVQEDQGGTGFVKVTYAAADGSMVIDRWIKAEALIKGPSDVDAAIALAVVGKLAETDKDLKINILDGAVSSYAASALLPDLQGALNALTLPELVQEPGTCTVVVDSASIRSAPDATVDNIVANLAYSDVVDVTERSVQEFTVDGQVGYWYHVSYPYDGWVFGAYLQTN